MYLVFCQVFFLLYKNIIFRGDVVKLNIKQIGDIHFNRSFSLDQLLKLEKIILDKNTDYIIFTGDIIDSTKSVKDKKQRQILREWFKKISKNKKVIIELGNHDISKSYDNRKSWASDTEETFWEEISKLKNIWFLPNDVFYKDKYIYVTGINPSLYYYENTNLKESKKDILYTFEHDDKHFSNLDSDKLNIFISHSPIHMSDKEVLKYIKEFDLILSGHMHNGLVFPFMEKIFPKNRGIISPLRDVFPDNARGIKDIKYENRIIKLIITGGVTKFAASHGFVRKLNKFYPSVIEEIIYDTENKKIEVNTLKL